MDIRRRIQVSGIVQGVGFRPFVYRLANERGLVGHVGNDAAGVTIEIQGSADSVNEFVSHLPREAPPLARITDIIVHELPLNGDVSFAIVASEAGHVHTLISPDIAVCADCLRELFDPADRRHGYPFINCTNCGPRFTIVRNIPYDRPATSMAVFPMCAACRAEYDDPRNRRFHAQPNACWECGPQVELWDRKGSPIACDDPIGEAARQLDSGAVVAIKGLGGFHLAVDATNVVAVEKLRERKQRVEKPFAVMVRDVVTATQFCELDDDSREALESPQRPIVLLRKKDDTSIADAVAPGNRYLGVFLPYTPVHHLLFARGRFSTLVMTSGNLSEEPIAIGNNEAVDRLSALADCFLVHNRDILLRCDDSVVQFTPQGLRHLRRSRGYVPVPVFLKAEVPSVLAVGGELKNTICLTKGRHAFLSQHIGDLENLESYSFFEEAREHLQKILEIGPNAVAYDLHPDYFSTRWALQQSGSTPIGVQHHHAHIASCMAENHLDGKVIGFALDGTGYGSDGRIWGGEVLVAGYADFERAAHLEYVPLPGGAAAIREPWRMALSYLAKHFGAVNQLEGPFLKNLDSRKAALVLQMIERDVKSPLTSSCGRLFDAIAALTGLRQSVNYEGQAAIELEMVADTQESSTYPLELVAEEKGWMIRTKPLFDSLLQDLRENVPVSRISARFHNGLVSIFCQLALLLRDRTGLNRVCLSGGTFNNLYLTERLLAGLQRSGFEVFTHHEVPCGDGGLSLGQAMVAAHRLMKN
jgi:hydrogenase maturation protein HypF